MIHIRTDRRTKKTDLKVVFERGRKTRNQFSPVHGVLTVPAVKTDPLADAARHSGGSLFHTISDLAITSAVLDFSSSRMNQDEMLAVVEGFLLADSRDNYSLATESQTVDTITINVPELAEYRDRLDTIREKVHAVQTARDLILTPPNDQGPEDFARQCMNLIAGVLEGRPDTGAAVDLTLYTDADLEGMKMGLLRAVGAAGRPPVLLHGRYNPPPPIPVHIPRITLIGKGITFDSGGLDLKAPAGMLKMKYDMSGAAAAFALFLYAVRRELPFVVNLVLPCAENLVSREAMRPGDVYKSFQGETVEITNTDAEGRLVLADALSWSKQFESDITIDLATLTGAASITAGWNVVALGNQKRLVKNYLAAAMRSGEKAIELPLWEEYADELNSDVADLKNATNTRSAGTISAAKFLERFAPDTGWLHLDIAASAWQNRKKSYLPSGPTGAGVRSVAQLLEAIADNPATVLGKKKS